MTKVNSTKWIVTGRNKAGYDWFFLFVGEKPSTDRINYVFATEFPYEWDCEPEIKITNVKEIGPTCGHLSNGPTLLNGMGLDGYPVD